MNYLPCTSHDAIECCCGRARAVAAAASCSTCKVPTRTCVSEAGKTRGYLQDSHREQAAKHTDTYPHVANAKHSKATSKHRFRCPLRAWPGT